jgi:hypothetical protein
MSDYEGVGKQNIEPPGKRVRKPRAKLTKVERKDNLDILPDGYVETTINGMTVLVKKPVETKVVEHKPVSVPVSVPVSDVKPPITSVKKPRKKSAWSMAVGEFGMPKKNTDEYKKMMLRYDQLKQEMTKVA